MLVIHFLSFGFAGFVAYVARPSLSDASLFAWHPTLMTAAFTFLAAEAVMMLSRNSLLGSSANRDSKVLGHFFFMLGAVVCAVLGFWAVYSTKEKYEKPHFQSPHALVGCAAVGYIVMQSCAGLNLLFPQFVGKFINIRQLGRMHGLSGCVLLLVATLALLGGLNMDWFRERVTGWPWFVCLAVPLVIYGSIAKQVLFRARDERKPKKQS